MLSQYVRPLLHDLENGDIDFSDSGKAVDKISKSITHHSASLADPSVATTKWKNKRNVYVRLPEDVKTARSHFKVAFESWKNNDYSDGKRREYRFKLRNFLNQLEAEKITKLCNAADSNEKLFWRLLKGQRSNLTNDRFLVDGKLITDKKQIREMWADHFEALGTPSVSVRYDNNFLTPVLLPASKIPVQKTHLEY